MTRNIVLLGLSLCCSLTAMAQQMSERDYIRQGNQFYVDSLFEKAEVEYRKALDLNAANTDALFNLGNALFNQVSQTSEKAQEALSQYVTASKLETDKARLAHIYHNMGVLLYMAQQYGESVEAYKEALRNNPADHETRYNLAMAMHMNKQQQQQQDQQQDQQQQNQEQQQQEQQQNQEQEQQQQEQQQQEQQQQEQKQEQDQQQEQQAQQQEHDEQISKENAEQILNALMQDEKELQEKQKKMMQQQQGKTLEKDW